MAREDPNMPVGAAAMLRMVPNVPLALPLVCRMSTFQKDCFRGVRAALRREGFELAGAVPFGHGGNNWDERSRSRG